MSIRDTIAVFQRAARLHPRSALITVVTVAGIGAAIASGCKSGGSTTAPGVTPPPAGSVTFNFTFPAAGSSASRQFTAEGVYDYRCIAHQSLGMSGTVEVSASAPRDTQIVLVGHNNGYTFSPTDALIRPNGYILWQREVGANGTTFNNHTATRP
ncbi:MAG: plastocyanin/azurin family copper-binding protein [Candidatus Eisenbacteria bacterium]